MHISEAYPKATRVFAKRTVGSINSTGFFPRASADGAPSNYIPVIDNITMYASCSGAAAATGMFNLTVAGIVVTGTLGDVAAGTGTASYPLWSGGDIIPLSAAGTGQKSFSVDFANGLPIFATSTLTWGGVNFSIADKSKALVRNATAFGPVLISENNVAGAGSTYTVSYHWEDPAARR